MSLGEKHFSYISNVLIAEIEKELQPTKLLEFSIENSTGLNGFMSALYTINIKVFDDSTKKESAKTLLAKFMKGDENFRVSSRCYIQFANEVFIYSQVIPYYADVIAKAGIENIKPSNWIPRVYIAKYGIIEGLSDGVTKSPESVLVLEHLKEQGYRMGPVLYLDKPHMLEMMKPLSEYHAMTYTLRIKNDEHLEKLIKTIIPLPFIETGPTFSNFYDPVFKVALDRFFEFFERCKTSLISPENSDDMRLEYNINKLHSKYGSNPTRLLEFIRSINDADDEKYAAILHGDFNRNNVMFRYEKGGENPKDCKMIDFQELRYGTPCIDLSFAMYLNMKPSIRDEFWMELLMYYQTTLNNVITAVVKPVDEDTHLASEYYSFKNFYKHFTKYAFYGVMLCMHYLPWLVGTEEELKLLSKEFECNVHGESFYKISFSAGGDEANNRILNIVRHASKMGYMDII